MDKMYSCAGAPGGKHRYDNGRNEIDDHRMIVVSGYDAKLYRRKEKRKGETRREMHENARVRNKFVPLVARGNKIY